MNFDFTEKEEAFRKEVRAWLAAHREGGPLPGDGARRVAAAREPRRGVDARPDPDATRDAGAAAALPAEDPHGRGAVVPGLLRAERRLGSRQPPDARGARGGSLRRERPEGVDEH